MYSAWACYRNDKETAVTLISLYLQSNQDFFDSMCIVSITFIVSEFDIIAHS